jgi:hypothetical protein
MLGFLMQLRHQQDGHYLPLPGNCQHDVCKDRRKPDLLRIEAGLCRPNCFNHAIKLLLLMAMFLTLATTSCSDAGVDYYKSGVAKQTKGDLDGAIADYAKAIQLKPDLEKP